MDWRARGPGLARVGLDEWKVTLGVKGTLRTAEARVSSLSSASPASFEGNLSLAMTRSRRDFLSAEVSFRASTAEYRAGEEPQAPLEWERLGEEERKQLDDLRALMGRQLAGKLMTSLDEDTRGDIWLE